MAPAGIDATLQPTDDAIEGRKCGGTKVRAWPIIGALLLGGCQPSLVDTAQDAVRRHLKDPKSAQFTSVRQCGTADMVAGEVNAKNEFGGYTGPKNFAYAEGRAAIADEDRQARSVLSDGNAGEFVKFTNMCTAAIRTGA